jgi:hypothetical protein
MRTHQALVHQALQNFRKKRRTDPSHGSQGSQRHSLALGQHGQLNHNPNGIVSCASDLHCETGLDMSSCIHYEAAFGDLLQ